MRWILMILTLAASLAACGQKGPLVLVAPPATPRSTPAPTAPSFPGVPATTEKK